MARLNSEEDEYIWLDGRRYHNVHGASYMLPNDIDEVDRLQLQHFILRYSIQGNYKSPLDKSKVRSILDVGCGPGTWTLEMAAEFEKARVVGLDMCQVFPTSIIPPNCEFVQHNLVEGRLPFEDNTFDFVFQRLLLGGLRPKEWRHVVRELGRVTKPGGWIELVEIDGSGGNNGPKTMKVWNWIHQAFATQGIDVYIGRQQGLKKLLEEEACLPLVHHDTLQLDTGEHGGKIGELLKENEVAFWRAMTPLVLQRSQVTHEHFEQAIAEAEEEIEEYKSYHIFYCAYGQKPEKTLEEMDI